MMRHDSVFDANEEEKSEFRVFTYQFLRTSLVDIQPSTQPA